MQKEETKVMKSGQLPPGKLLSDKFVSYNELARPLRPPSGKRIEGKLKKQIPKVKGQLPMSSSQTKFNSINPEQDAKLERMTRPFSKGSNRPSSASKLSRSYSKENIKSKDTPYITAQPMKQGTNEIEDKQARNRIAECLQAHSKREMQRKVVHAAFQDISDSDAMSERLFEEMKGQRQPSEQLSMSTSLAEQEFDAALKVGNQLVLYEPEEMNAVVEINSLEDQTHQSAMQRIYAQVENLQKQAQEAREIADGMMEDIQGRLDGEGQPLLHIPENFEEVINIVESQTRDEMIKRSENKGEPTEKKLPPFWAKFIKADARTILDPEKRAKQEKILKELNKIQKQEVKLAKLKQEQREKKRQEKEKALRDMDDQELRETYSSYSHKKEASRRSSNLNIDITDPDSDTFLTNMVGSAKKRIPREETPKKGPGGLDIINEEGTPQSHLSPALSKPNISKKNLNSQNTTRTDFSKNGKNFVEQNIKRAFERSQGHTSMMNNLSDAERNRVNALLKQIEIEEPQLRKLKTEISFSSNRNKSVQNSSAAQSHIDQDRLTIISATPSTISVAKSMIGENEAKMIENIDNNLRQLVPIDKWEICSLKPHNQKTLSTIQDIESQVSDFTGLGVTSNVTGRTSSLLSMNSSNRRPKENVLREQSERRETLSKLNSIDKNIASLIYQSSSVEEVNQKLPEADIKELILNCKKIGEGGLGGPLEIVREEELNDGQNPEMAAIIYQESILDQASQFAKEIEQRIEEQRSKLLAIEYKEEAEEEKGKQKVQITQEELENKIKNFDSILMEKSELVTKLLEQENALREMEEKMEKREQLMKSAKKAAQQSQIREMKLFSQLELDNTEFVFKDLQEQEEEKDRFEEMQREAKYFMKEEEGDLQRGQDGQIDLDSLVNNVSRLPICPLIKD